MAIFTTLRDEIHNSMHKLQNSMEVDSVGIIAILSMSYITTRKCGENPQSAVENQITTLSMVKTAIKLSPCRWAEKFEF